MSVLVTRSSELRDLLVRSVVLLLLCPTLPSLGVSEALGGTLDAPTLRRRPVEKFVCLCAMR